MHPFNEYKKIHRVQKDMEKDLKEVERDIQQWLDWYMARSLLCDILNDCEENKKKVRKLLIIK